MATFDSAARAILCDSLRAHAEAVPSARAIAAGFFAFVRDTPDCAERSRSAGHLTASAWLVSADGARTLLTHHAKLGRWLQPGGHADGDLDLAAVALREAGEESGLRGLVVDAAIHDLDRHWIPARGTEAGHWHWDVRYVVRATADEDFVVSRESLALAWRPVEAVARDPALDASLRRMAQRWLEVRGR